MNVRRRIQYYSGWLKVSTVSGLNSEVQFVTRRRVRRHERAKTCNDDFVEIRRIGLSGHKSSFDSENKVYITLTIVD